jgi:recombination associated protein RdgC
LVLTDGLQARRLAFLDGVFDGVAEQDRGFDADAAIVTGELRRLLPDLLEALGGELDPMATPAAANGTAPPPAREAA